jgi:hypothetical protein
MDEKWWSRIKEGEGERNLASLPSHGAAAEPRVRKEMIPVTDAMLEAIARLVHDK